MAPLLHRSELILTKSHCPVKTDHLLDRKISFFCDATILHLHLSNSQQGDLGKSHPLKIKRSLDTMTYVVLFSLSFHVVVM